MNDDDYDDTDPDDEPPNTTGFFQFLLVALFILGYFAWHVWR